MCYEADACESFLEAIRSPDEAPAKLRVLYDRWREREPAALGETALWAAYAGDEDLALDALETYVRRVNSPALQSLWFPVLSDVRKDPRFKAIVRELGFVDLWRDTGDWPDDCRVLGDDDFACF